MKNLINLIKTEWQSTQPLEKLGMLIAFILVACMVGAIGLITFNIYRWLM